MYLCGVLTTAALSAVKPNIVMILTDDQDTRMGRNPSSYSDIGSLESQPKLRKEMMEGGVRMENYFVHTPICCPSRTEYFTGRYFHNLRSSDGKGCMHANTTDVHLMNTGLFGLLTSHGYETGVFGKTTNDQQDQLDGLVAEGSVTWIDSPLDYNNYNCSVYYRYNKTEGKQYNEKINATDPVYGSIYQTSQLSNRTAAWLDVILSVPEADRKPFFAYIGPHAPHYPAYPAPWHADLYPDYEAPRTPNYNLSSPDKTNHIRQNAGLTELAKCWEDQLFRDRWRTLASVDDLVEIVFNKVRQYGVFDNTYFIYSSDHGYKLGQWRVADSKMHPYETDIRIPFLISGPGIPKNATISNVAGSVDLLPTILEIAGVEVPSWIDGRSFAGALITDKQLTNHSRDVWLTEYQTIGQLTMTIAPIWAADKKMCTYPEPKGPTPTGKVNGSCVESTNVGDGNCYLVDSTKSNTWRALRIINATHNMQYIQYDHTWTWNTSTIQFYELYDVAADPYQMHNLYDTYPDNLKDALNHELENYFGCSGATCP
eukprot:TRINITY_DN11254_c0_g1_i1.p1 TRINITY_DN11254_c0_g1~~TRINITY_DN11254_c0_g1_i1.p1  ORF type:complete len:541 (+),score=79.30 TRINITY_DN11254_c0_g1_i1:494-2116(+)